MMNYRILIFSIASAAATSAFAQTYTIHEIPAGLPLLSSPVCYSVNDKGDFLITQFIANGPGTAFVWDGKNLTAVPANSGDTLYAINNLGNFVGLGNNGSYFQDKSGKQTAITSPNGDGLYVNNLNNKNIACGQANTSAGGEYGFLWNAGTVTAFNYPNEPKCSIYGLNDKGDFVGSFIDAQGTYHAFTDRSGKAAELKISGYTLGFMAAINNGGTAVGTATIVGNSNYYVAVVAPVKGVPKTYDWSNSGAPKAIPGPKGPLTMLPTNAATNFWSISNTGTISGQFSAGYQSDAAGVTISLPIKATVGGS